MSILHKPWDAPRAYWQESHQDYYIFRGGTSQHKPDHIASYFTRNPANQLRLAIKSHYLQGFIHPNGGCLWLFGLSSIHSTLETWILALHYDNEMVEAFHLLSTLNEVTTKIPKKWVILLASNQLDLGRVPPKW